MGAVAGTSIMRAMLCMGRSIDVAERLRLCFKPPAMRVVVDLSQCLPCGYNALSMICLASTAGVDKPRPCVDGEPSFAWEVWRDGWLGSRMNDLFWDRVGDKVLGAGGRSVPRGLTDHHGKKHRRNGVLLVIVNVFESGSIAGTDTVLSR